MGLTITTEPASEPLTTTELKTHLRYNKSDEDDLIGALISAARKRYEIETRRVLINTSYTWTRDDFPGTTGTTRLPRGPLQEFTRIVYTDTSGDAQTLSTAIYQLGQDGEMPARLTVRHNEIWPDTRQEIDSVKIKFVAGHGSAASEIPEIDKAAVKMIVGHWWSNREEVLSGQGYTVTKIPMGVSRIIPMRTLPTEGSFP